MNQRALHNRKSLNCTYCGAASPSYEERGVSDGAFDPIVGPLACGNCFMKLNDPVNIDRTSPEMAKQLKEMLATPYEEASDGLDEEE